MSDRLAAVTDRLILRGLPPGSDFYGWDGPWPPPQRLAVVWRAGGSVGTVCEAEKITEAVRQEMAFTTLTVSYWELVRASEITTPAPADANWCRAAEYVREGST